MGKYLFFDVDGTLFDPEIHIPDSTKEGFRRLRDNGHHLFISTGRTKCLLFSELLDLGFEGMICGSGTYMEHEGRELFRYEMPVDETVELMNTFHDNDMYIFAEGTELLFCDEYKPVAAPDLVRFIFNTDTTDFIRSSADPLLRVSKISGFSKTDDRDVSDVFRLLSEKYTCVMHGKNYIETIKPGFSKGQAILELSRRLGFDMNDTYAFGDSMNDLDMLRTVKYGVAMGNGNPDLLRAVSLHTDDFRNDGLYKGLKMMELI
ncbi:MAG: Cof-type HAD-IIB family hydrolase [Parasporobacterium sp.]|nr:Cof-type HAD-IIB family hydrolase [Parasporobacterium sp.]